MLLLKIINAIRVLIKRQFFKIIFLKKIQIGKNFSFRKRINLVIEKNAKLIIGDNVFFNHDCSVNCLSEISIGNNVLFGENVKMYDHNHIYTDKSKLISKQGFSCSPIIIEDNCWIGSNVTILKNVRIGKNSVIGTGVTVYKDIPEGSVIINKQTQMYL